MSIAMTLGRVAAWQVGRTSRKVYASVKPKVARLGSRVLVASVLVLFVLLFLLSHIIAVIRPGQVGVLYSLFSGGTVLDRTYGEGIHFIWPWDVMYRYDTRVHEYTADLKMQAREGLTVEVAASIRYRIPRAQVPSLHVDYGPTYERVLVSPIFLSAVREAIGQYHPEQLYSTAPAEIQEKALADALRKAAHLPIEIDDIVFKAIKLPADVDRAIEAKLIEQQEVLRYQFVLEKSYKEALRRVIEAEGIRLYQQGINAGLTENFLRYKGIEATTALAASANAKVVVVGGRDGLPLIMNPDAPPASAPAIAPPPPASAPPAPAPVARAGDRGEELNAHLEEATASLHALWSKVMSARIPAKTLVPPSYPQ